MVENGLQRLDKPSLSPPSSEVSGFAHPKVPAWYIALSQAQGKSQPSTADPLRLGEEDPVHRSSQVFVKVAKTIQHQFKKKKEENKGKDGHGF